MRVFFSVLKMRGTMNRDLFLPSTRGRRSVAILRMDQALEVAMIFMLLLTAMRTQAVTLPLEIRIGMTQGWTAVKCSPVNSISKWKKLKCLQSLSKPMLNFSWHLLNSRSVPSINRLINQSQEEDERHHTRADTVNIACHRRAYFSNRMCSTPANVINWISRIRLRDAYRQLRRNRLLREESRDFWDYPAAQSSCFSSRNTRSRKWERHRDSQNDTKLINKQIRYLSLSLYSHGHFPRKMNEDFYMIGSIRLTQIRSHVWCKWSYIRWLCSKLRLVTG
jgi:hypothetical protein